MKTKLSKQELISMYKKLNPSTLKVWQGCRPVTFEDKKKKLINKLMKKELKDI